MHTSPPQDPGIVRWYVFIPDTGLFAIPLGVADPLAYGRDSPGASLVRRGNEVVWRRDRAGISRDSHLAVVR